MRRHRTASAPVGKCGSGREWMSTPVVETPLASTQCLTSDHRECIDRGASVKDRKCHSQSVVAVQYVEDYEICTYPLLCRCEISTLLTLDFSRIKSNNNKGPRENSRFYPLVHHGSRPCQHACMKIVLKKSARFRDLCQFFRLCV